MKAGVQIEDLVGPQQRKSGPEGSIRSRYADEGSQALSSDFRTRDEGIVVAQTLC